MDLFPAFLELRGRRVVVVGGGEVAARKIALLLDAGAHIRVVSPTLHPELATRLQVGELEHRAGEFLPADLDDAFLAIAATGNPAVNRAVAAAGEVRRIFVNAVDDAAACSFQMPAIVDRSPLIVAIGTGGGSPVLARRVRTQIEALLPAQLATLAGAAARWRARARAALPEVAQRRRFWDRFFGAAAASPASWSTTVLDAEIQSALDAAAVDATATATGTAAAGMQRGEVWLIGAGPGDPDLLTLRALQLLQECDVVLYDRLVGERVLERVRRDARRVFVGKESGAHRTTQTRIHELLLEHARQGLRVARLKGGDPLVFGRGGEEIEALAAAGIAVTVVPGVTAALGAAAVAGIPLTHRGVSQAVTFVTAMGEAAAALDWRALAAPLQTTVFYMGVAQLPAIVERLLAHGAPNTRAVAIVERATLRGQRTIAATLADIVDRAHAAAVRAPALLIVGDVVKHAAPRSTSRASPESDLR